MYWTDWLGWSLVRWRRKVQNRAVFCWTRNRNTFKCVLCLLAFFHCSLQFPLMTKNKKITQVSAMPACPSSLLITHCTDVSVSVIDFTLGILFVEDVIVNSKHCQFHSYMIVVNFGTTPYHFENTPIISAMVSLLLHPTLL